MLRPSPNHGTQRLPNDDDDDDGPAWKNDWGCLCWRSSEVQWHHSCNVQGSSECLLCTRDAAMTDESCQMIIDMFLAHLNVFKRG